MYLNQTQDPRRRAIAIVTVGAIHAALGFVVITGLGVEFIDRIDPPPFAGRQIPLDPPPPDPTPATAIDPVVPTPPAPVPPIEIPRPPGPVRVVFDPTDIVDLDVRRVPDPGPTLTPPRPAPSFTPRGAAPSNDRALWITNADYPASALRRADEGLAAYRLIVGSDGRVSACEITASSGNRALDDATCRLIARRARFDAATDETGARIVGNYSGTVRWLIPD